MSVSAKTFIRTWQQSDNVEMVALLCNITVHSASCRASDYRKRGIPLKRFAPGIQGKQLDIDDLSQLAKELE